MEKMIEFFSLVLNNPITKRAIKHTLKKDDDGVVKLDKYLQAYAMGIDLKSLEFKALKKLIETGLKAFGGDEKLLMERLRDGYWRRGFISVLRGLVDFGVLKPFVPGSPFLIVWDVTYRCNLRCKHCYSTAGKPWSDELDTEKAKRSIDILADAGVTSIAFSGGEPLMRKDFFELAKTVNDYGMFVSLATNGTLLNKETVKKLKECGVWFVQISLDGTKEAHEAFRGIKGIYDKVIEGIKNCVDEGLITCISTTATTVNYTDVVKVMDLAEELGVQWFMLYNFIPVGRGDFEMDLNAEQRERLLRELWSRFKATGINFMSTAPYYARIALQEESDVVPTHFYNPRLEGQLKVLSEFIGGCGCGRFYLAMRSNGNIEPCVFFPLKLANILDFKDGDDFLDFWRNNKVLRELRNKDLIEVCGECRYRYVCGGCRARAYAYYKDYLKPDPGCIIACKRIKTLKVKNEDYKNTA